MLARYVVDTGVAVAKTDKSDIYLAVQVFARPRSAATEFEVANRSEQTVRYTVGGRDFPLPPRLIRTHRVCTPQTFKFLPLDSEKAASHPAKPVATVQPSDGQRLTVVPSGDGYRVEVGRSDSAEGGTGEA